MSTTEQKLRTAAQAFQDALLDAKAEGLHVAWPVHPDQLNALAISETKATAVTVQVVASEEMSADIVAKAGTAAQKAVDRTVAKASE
jgi:hypothetical protein